MSQPNSGAVRGPPGNGLSTLGTMLIAALAIAALGRVLWLADLGRAVALVRGVGPAALLVLAPTGVVFLCHALAWRRILRGQGHEVPLATLFTVIVRKEAILSTFPGGTAVAETAVPVMLAQRSAVPLPDAVASTVVKKGLTLTANGAVLIVGGALGAALGSIAWVLGLAGLGLFAVGALGLTLLGSGRAAGLLLTVARRVPSRRAGRWLDARAASVAATDQALRATLSRSRRAGLWGPGATLVAGWLVEGLDTALALALLGAPLLIQEAVALESGASLVRSLAIGLPSGLGAQDAAYAELFARAGVLDAATIAVAFVVLKRAKELCWVAAGWLLFGLDAARPRRGGPTRLVALASPPP